MKLRIAASAKQDLQRIHRYYEGKRPGLGAEFLETVGKNIRGLKDFPAAWPEFHAGTRRFILDRFPYGVVYRVGPSEILVVLVAHLKRSPAYWRKRSTRSD
jgi:plasmid stabilization system protein ParE